MSEAASPSLTLAPGVGKGQTGYIVKPDAFGPESPFLREISEALSVREGDAKYYRTHSIVIFCKCFVQAMFLPISPQPNQARPHPQASTVENLLFCRSFL